MTSRLYLVCSFIVFISPSVSHAYLDPGAGSYLFQMLIAGFLGGIFAAKSRWRELKIYLIGVWNRLTSKQTGN